jgi:hypothetical protein
MGPGIKFVEQFIYKLANGLSLFLPQHSQKDKYHTIIL